MGMHAANQSKFLRRMALLALGALSACTTTLSPGGDASFDDAGAVDGEADTASGLDSGQADGGADVGVMDAATPMDAAAPMDAAMDAGPPPPPPCPRARVNTPGETLNVRPDASTGSSPVGSLPHGYLVEVVAMVRGQTIDGADLWFEISSPIARGFVFATFVECTEDELPADDGNYYMPFACGASIRVTQSPGGSTSHTGRSAYAFDFGVPLNTPIHAARAGRVTAIRTATRPGHPCYDGGGPSCGSDMNWVILQHPDGNTSAYLHLNDTAMTVGTEVRRGDVIGASGSTGYSTGPHLHLEVRGSCPTNFCQTISFSMADVGRPEAPVTVTSGNCP
ncbi:MAG: hypothetical protein ACI9KE_003108 [Polyangiales bacterium]